MAKKIIWIAIAFIVSFGTAAAVYADGDPLLYGTLNVAVVDEDAGDDIHLQANEMAFGLRGMYQLEDISWLKIAYRLEMEVTKAINGTGETGGAAANGEGDIEIKSMVVAGITDYGTLVLAPYIESGQQRDLYGPVDLFDIYEANRNGGLFDQPDEVAGVVAYVSPKFLGGLQLKAANANLGEGNDDNEEDSDAQAFRLIYKSDTIFAGLGTVIISDKVVPTDDYKRVQAGLQYKFKGGHQIGATWESITDQPARGDFDTIGVAARANFGNGFDLGVAYYSQSGDQENSAVIANVRKHFNKRIYCYAEYGAFDEDDPDLSYWAIGFNVGFRGKP